MDTAGVAKTLVIGDAIDDRNGCIDIPRRVAVHAEHNRQLLARERMVRTKTVFLHHQKAFALRQRDASQTGHMGC